MKEMLYQLSYLDIGAEVISLPHKGARLINQILVYNQYLIIAQLQGRLTAHPWS